MTDIYTAQIEINPTIGKYSNEDFFSVLYHDLFDYPLNFADLIKWRVGRRLFDGVEISKLVYRNGFAFIDGREGLVYKRILRSRISNKKMDIANRAADLLSKIPTIRMVGITGSLAMMNSDDGGDVDLIVITKGNTLWFSRGLALFMLKLTGFAVRRFGQSDQKNKLCLNMWLDESDLKWAKNRNIYTAHEIAQIKPLFNKNKTYEKLLRANKWILKYWPNSVRIDSENKVFNLQEDLSIHINYLIFSIVEKIFYKLQYLHMKSKITHETITPTRALFHPLDWSKIVLARLKLS